MDLAYYDDVADLTWLADANYAKTSGYDADGQMSWDKSMAWVSGLSVGGVEGWRLPSTLQPDPSCSVSSGWSEGYYCDGSEMGNLFYIALGNSPSGLKNYESFSNLQDDYWSATEDSLHNNVAWIFKMYNGEQITLGGTTVHSAWAVHSGDVGAVPIPSAVWLFGSGLIGLIGLPDVKLVHLVLVKQYAIQPRHRAGFCLSDSRICAVLSLLIQIYEGRLLRIQ